MNAKENEFITLIIVALLVYSFFIVDFVPSIDTSVIFNPISRFFILLMMLLASRFNMFLTVLIGFAYTITKFKMLFTEERSAENDNRINKMTFIEKRKKMDMSRSTSTNFEFPPTLTTEQNLDEAQSNVVDEEAMQTEIKTWNDGYGAQGLSLKPTGKVPTFEDDMSS